MFQEEVTKRTKGAITFESFWGASMGAPAAHIELLQNNVVQVIQTHQWYTPSKMPLGDFEFVFPFGPTDAELVVKAMRQIRSEFPAFAEELAKNNAVLIADTPQGSYNFLSKEPLTTIDGFKGKKVGLIGRYFGRWLPPGATAVVRPAHERYDLLKTGVTTADLNPFDNQIAFKLNEVTNYFIKDLSLTTCLPMPILMNLQTFNGFSKEIQNILLEVGREVEIRTAKEILPRWWDRAMKDWKAGGMEFITFRPGEKEKWVAGLEDIPSEWAADMEKIGLPGFKIVQRWQEITEGMGYKWPRKWGVKR
jgi:TRAP-type C4-dicarboxylate transport system substrate-binding protein